MTVPSLVLAPGQIDRTCAASGTGKGELFIRTALAHSIHARMLYSGQGLKEAALAQIEETARMIPASASLCAVNIESNVVLPFNSEGMYRGWNDGRRQLCCSPRGLKPFLGTLALFCYRQGYYPSDIQTPQSATGNRWLRPSPAVPATRPFHSPAA